MKNLLNKVGYVLAGALAVVLTLVLMPVAYAASKIVPNNVQIRGTQIWVLHRGVPVAGVGFGL
jgi:hypothetical protein